MNKIVVSFDVDGTIVKPEYNELIWFKEVPQLYAKKYGVDLEKAKKLVIEEYEKVGEDDVRWYSLEYWLKHFGFDPGEREILEKYAGEVDLYPEVISTLELLERNYTLIISSAMSEAFIRVKLEKDKIFRYFKRVFSSISHFAMTKKEKAFYQKVCEKMGISPLQLIHVGDNYQADYLIPRQIGIKAFYLNRTNCNYSHPYVVGDLEEFVRKIS